MQPIQTITLTLTSNREIKTEETKEESNDVNISIISQNLIDRHKKGLQQISGESHDGIINQFSPFEIIPNEIQFKLFSYIPRVKRAYLFCINRAFNAVNQELVNLEGQIEIRSLIKETSNFSMHLNSEKYTYQKEQINHLIKHFENQKEEGFFTIRSLEIAKKEFMDDLMLQVADENFQINQEELGALKSGMQLHEGSQLSQSLLELIKMLLDSRQNQSNNLIKIIGMLVHRGHLKTALEMMKKVDNDERIEIFQWICENFSLLGRQVDKALELAKEIQNTYKKSKVLANISKHSLINKRQIDQILKMTKGIENEYDRYKLIDSICKGCLLTERQVDKILKIAKKITQNNAQKCVLMSIHKHCFLNERQLNKVRKIG